MQCTDPECEAGIWAATDLKVKFDPTTFRAEEPYPKCIKCDNLARPNVLMFGDYGWLDDRHVRQKCLYRLVVSQHRTDGTRDRVG
jgi:hypothetical protein